MKKFNFKNCIAFTLTEMTLVLLITSVIAASATPIITSKVADTVGKGGREASEISESPWKSSNNYNGGGIYNSPETKTAFISIAHKPGADASVYGYPSLLINSANSKNFIKAPQITIIPTKNVLTTATNRYYQTKIAMDAYENIAFVYSNESFANISDDKVIGQRNIYIGDYIQNNLTANNDLTADRSIFMGYGINANTSVDAINIGSNIRRLATEKNTVNIGSDLYSIASSNNIFDNIYIGDHVAYGTNGRYNIDMGQYAGYASKTLRNVIIGTYAGYKMLDTDDYKNADNTVIGRYAFYFDTFGSNTTGHIGDVAIGNYAGSLLSNTKTSAKLYSSNSLMIGNYAGANIKNNGTTIKSLYDVAIGDYANAHVNTSGTTSWRSIYIGSHAGYNSTGSSSYDNSSADNIYIGSYAGYGAASYGSVAIGYYAAYDMNSVDSIAIGQYSGYNNQGTLNVFIGYASGYEARGTYMAGKYPLLGIGYQACKDVNAGSKMCIGSGTLDDYLSTSESRSIWNPSSPSPQMVIGFVNKGLQNQFITLYASQVYRIGKKTFDNASNVNVANYRLSDKRLKTNIVPSNRSIKDIRKINIYDYNFKNDEKKSPRIGIIAQEYRKVFPNDVSREPKTKKLTASSEWLIYTMVNAVKDVDKEVRDLQKNMKEYVADFKGLKSKIAKLEQQAEQIEKENTQMRAHLAKINEKLK